MNIKQPFIGFKTNCVLCGAASGSALALCNPCHEEIQPLDTRDLCCPRCALPLHATAEETLCGDCQKDPPPYSAAYRFALYQPPLDRMIQQLKFHEKLHFARLLGNLMARDIRRRNVTLPDVMLPVPLHTARLKQRGYNQALEVARYIARDLRLPLDLKSCVRHKATPEQAGLPAKQRTGNIKGAFQVARDVRDQHIAIVDDVMTTGSTVAELARTLLKKGARRVDVWVCARAVL